MVKQHLRQKWQTQ